MPGREAAPASRELGARSGRRGSGLREVLRPPSPIPHRRTAPPGEPEPSGRDLGGGWEGTAPGKEEGAIPG